MENTYHMKKKGLKKFTTKYELCVNRVLVIFKRLTKT